VNNRVFFMPNSEASFEVILEEGNIYPQDDREVIDRRM
jgi:hypothetical protein